MMSSSEDEEGTLAQDEFVVEKVLDKKIVEGVVYYYLKWVGFTEADNSWEPEDNLQCEDLIEEFEEKQKEIRRQERARRKEAKRQNSIEDDDESNSKSSDFVDGKIPKEILGVTNIGGVLRFLLKWEGLEEATFVFASDAKKHCPLLVIDYYEKILKFTEDSK